MSNKGKKLAVCVRGDKLYVAVVQNNTVVGTMSETVPVQIVTEDAITDTLKNVISLNKVKEIDVCMTLPDSKCITKVLDTGSMSDAEFKMNLPYEFRDYIPKNSEDEYVFDYQTLPQEKGKKESKVLAIAAPRVEIEKMKDIAEDCGLDLVRLVPESVGLGDLLSASGHDKEKTCIVDVGRDKVYVMVFDGRVCSGTNVIQDGIGTMDVFEFNSHVNAFYDKVVDEDQKRLMEQYGPTFERIAPKIRRAIDFYADQGLLDADSEVFLSGEGALMAPFMNVISRELGREAESIEDVIGGRKSAVSGALMAPVIGSATEIK